MHLLLIIGLALLIFGPNKLPELGKGLGESIRGFKQAMHEKEEAAPEDDSTGKTANPARKQSDHNRDHKNLLT
jgi:sec-independent protein translocase protein TatA